jgi:hypothetical protein
MGILDVPSYSRAAADALAAGAMAPAPMTPSPAKWVPTVAAAGGRYPAWLSNSGTRLFATTRSVFRWSDDEAVTWNDGFDFNTIHAGANVLSIRETHDGEVLVSTGIPLDATIVGRVYRSTGYTANPATTTWTKVLELSAPGVYATSTYGGFCVDGTTVLINEYGPKAGAAGAARYTYLSQDGGLTFRTIFDRLSTVDSVMSGLHMHGVVYDKWWDRVWVTFGDDTSGTYYSDDWRNTTPTWHAADYTTAVGGPYQSVAIIPLEKCLLLMTDGTPNGVNRIMRYDRTGASTKANPKVESAYQFDNSQLLTWLGQQPFQAKHIPNAPVLLPYGTDASAPKQAAKLLITWDGLTITEFWQDVAPPLGVGNSGLKAVVGPTAQNGLLIGYLDDGRTAGDYSKVKGPAPLMVRGTPSRSALAAYGQADHLHPGMTRSQYATHLVQPEGPILAVQTAATGIVNNARGVRVRAPRRGRLTKPHIYVAVQSGTLEVAIYKADNPRTRLWTSGAIACPAVGWQQIADDIGVTVEAGDPLIFYVVASDTTQSLARVGNGTGAYTSLPAALNESVAGASLKLLESYTTTSGPGSMPTSITEASIASGIASAPCVIARIE